MRTARAVYAVAWALWALVAGAMAADSGLDGVEVDVDVCCATSIPPGGAIHRKPATDGTTAASYDVAIAPSPMDCVP